MVPTVLQKGEGLHALSEGKRLSLLSEGYPRLRRPREALGLAAAPLAQRGLVIPTHPPDAAPFWLVERHSHAPGIGGPGGI